MPEIRRQLELAQIMNQRGNAKVVQLGTFHAQRTAQQQRDHHHVDRVQGIALAHTFRQQPDDRITVFQEFGHAT
ncbi:hypothetical protein D3C72_2071470 [compost metagenome]